MDVRGLGADHSVIRLGEGLQAENISGGTVKNEKDLDVGAEMFLEGFDGGGCVRIITISHDMALVGGCERVQYGRMHTSIVVAGKAAGGFHRVPM